MKTLILFLVALFINAELFAQKNLSRLKEEKRNEFLVKKSKENH